MNNNKQKVFEEQCKKFIPVAPFEDIVALFEEKKQQYQVGIFNLLINKIKDRINKTKTTQFLELGYDISKSLAYSIRFINDIFDLSMKYERSDVIEYMFEKNYLNFMGPDFYLRQTVNSKKVLSHILSIPEISENIKSHQYAQMLKRCAMHNLVDSFDIVCQNNIEEIQKISQPLKTEILLSCAENNSFDMLKKLLKMKEPLKFDIEDKEEDPFGIVHMKKNLLILAAKNDNVQTMKYLLTSPELEKHVSIEESFWWLERLPNNRKIMRDIFIEIKAPLSNSLEKMLEGSLLLEDIKKRDFMIKLEEKLPIKNDKTKVKKI